MFTTGELLLILSMGFAAPALLSLIAVSGVQLAKARQEWSDWQLHGGDKPTSGYFARVGVLGAVTAAVVLTGLLTIRSVGWRTVEIQFGTATLIGISRLARQAFFIARTSQATR
ncbi:hypothetical protein [Actinokineospora diospyrosa]|uniref:SdpI/YhfL family protein n=1 Tax=Actinokineospora diospyrosa TaxID=103728 RepID=A0ABT1IDG9_9PSEU|nr:hypothetical protein [Actinokineospora diospyrosa]MCP2270670.1 hypothetical protein [Actinokineospora diospyrosa]